MGAPGRAEHIGDTPDGRQIVRVLCSVGDASNTTQTDGVALEWIQVLPGGQVVAARDDRIFQVLDAQGIIARSELPMLVDWEHDSEKWDGSTEAAGWITSLETSDGSNGRALGLWASVEWTPKGKLDVDTKAYRYLSPVLMIDGGESRAVLSIASVALTNKPALSMTQIGKFREQLSARFGLQTAEREPAREVLPVVRDVADAPQETCMNPETRKALCAALSLAEDAADSPILAAVSTLGAQKALLSEQTAQLNTANSALNAAKTELDAIKVELAAAKADAAKATLESRITALFEEHKAKFTPATAKSYRAMFAKNPATLDSFEVDVLPTMPEIGGAAPVSILPTDAPTTPSVDGKAPTAITEKFRTQMRGRGLTDEQITAALANAEKSRAALGAHVDSEGEV